MTYDTSIFSYFWQAGLVVKFVMMVLLLASVFSWTFILDRFIFLKKTSMKTTEFEKKFWSGKDLPTLYAGVKKQSQGGVESIFQAGFEEFLRLCKLERVSMATIMGNTRRAMHAAQMRVNEKLEHHLSYLAIVGSTGPYVGLFGTVWGIMQAFRSLANVQQATISMVAPGIAEALIATALGLFAAIPAVIAYNRYLNTINSLMSRYDAFQEEFVNILIRQAQPIYSIKQKESEQQEASLPGAHAHTTEMVE